MANKRISELAVRTPQTSDLMLIGDPATGYSYKTTILDAINLGVPTTRTLTINGTTYDLSANRTWSVGTVTSVGLTMPAAFTVASSPVTSSGTIAVTAAGSATQYIRGDGTLADFPGGGGGGGSSVSYYLNGSVNQGTIGGVTYLEMNKTPILGAGTNFTINANGYIASFLTDAGDPALLKIPGGNWNTEFYFAASSGGGTPTYYIELYKYDGTTFTLIASSSTNPDVISGGTSVEAYFTTLAVPETVLTATDRLAIRIYVTHAGRTITLHTENSNLCQVITTFSTGLTALNGLTAQVQYFATGTTGTDFNISSSTATHTFNLPTASATNRGALSSADWTTFNNKVTSIIAGNAITVSNASGNVTINHADTSGADPGATISGSNVFRSIVLDTYGHVTGLSYSSFLISDLGDTAISSPATNDVLRYNGTNWVNSSLSSLSIITGSGTTNWVPRFTSSSAIGLSNIYDNNTFVGIFTSTDNLSGAKLQVSGAATFSSSVTAGSNAGTASAINSYNTFGGSGTAQYYQDFGNGAGFVAGRILRGNGASGLESNGLNIDNYAGFKVRLNQLGGSGGSFTIDGGNLGLGVTPSAWTWKALQNGSFSMANVSNVGFLTANAFWDGAYKYVNTGASQVLEINNSNEFRFLTAASGTAGNAITFTQAMTLTAAGNLGIGTASPTTLLQVQKDQNAYTWARVDNQNNNAAAYSGLQFGAYGNSWGIAIGSSLANSNALTFVIDAGGTNAEKMRITSAGNVGIGTASPAAVLEVAGTSATTDFRISRTVSASTYFYITAPGGSPSTSIMGVNGTNVLAINSSGRVLIGTTTDNLTDILQVAGSVNAGIKYRAGTYTQGSTTPSVSGVSYLLISNSSATSITNFTGASQGQILTLVFSDANTTITRNNAYLSGGVNYTSTAYDTLTLIHDGTYWYEVSRSTNS